MSEYKDIPCYNCLTLGICRSMAIEHDKALKSSPNMIATIYVFVINAVENDRCMILSQYLNTHDNSDLTFVNSRIRNMQKIYNYLIYGEVEYARF